MQPGTDVFFAKTLRKRNHYSIEEKLQIYDFKQKNPKESFDKIAKIFQETWGKPMTKQHVHQIYTKIVNEKKYNVEFGRSDMNRRRLHSPFVRQFENDLYDSINKKLLKSHMTFETVEILAKRLQRSDKFKDRNSVQFGVRNFGRVDSKKKFPHSDFEP
jgi:signal recognition particle GTPase